MSSVIRKKVSVSGQSFPSIADAARHFNIPSALIRGRIKKGWTSEEAFGQSVRTRRMPQRGKKVSVQGKEFASISEAADAFGIYPRIARARLASGWTSEQTFGVEPPRRKKRKFENFEEIDGRHFPKGNAGTYKLYLITNRENGKVYVGITMGSLEKRWGEHVSMGPASIDTKLKRAIRKHGLESFTIRLLRLDASNYKELMEQEIAEIARRNAYNQGYNATKGGEFVFNARTVVVGEMTFPTMSSAAEYFEIDEGLIRARIDSMGWSIEEAVGLLKRPLTKYAPRGELMIADVAFPNHKAAAKHFGVTFQKYSLRLNRYGWTPEQALNLEAPPKGTAGVSIAVKAAGESFLSIPAAALRYGLHQALVNHRLKIGWSIEQALGLEKKPRKAISAAFSFTVNDRTFASQKAAAEHFGVNYKRYNALVKRHGWTPEQALGLVPPPTRETTTVTVKNFTLDSIPDAAKAFRVANSCSPGTNQ